MPLPKGFTLDVEQRGSFVDNVAADFRTRLNERPVTPPRGFVLDEPLGLHEQRLEDLQNAEGPGDSSLIHEIGQTPLGGIVTGAAKGLASTVTNLGGIASRNIPGLSTPNMFGKMIAPDETGAFSGQDTDVNAATIAEGPWQSGGKAAEQVAEFFVPGGSKAGVLKPIAGALKKAGIGGTMAREGINAAGVTGAQGGDPLIAGIAGAVIPGVLQGVAKVAPKVVNAVIGAGKKQFKYGADPGRGVVDEGIVAGTMDSLLEKVKGAKEAVGQQIQAALQKASPNTKLDVRAAINAPIDDAITKHQTAGNDAMVTRLEKLRVGVDKAFGKLGTTADSATPEQVFLVKKELDSTMRHTGMLDAVEASAKEVQRVVRRGLAQAISGSVKAVAALNKKYGDLAEAVHAIENKLNPGQMSQMLNAAGTLGLGGGTYAYTGDREKALAVMAGKYALKSAAGGTALAQLARGVGSEVAQRVGAKTAAAGISKATQKRKQK